MFLSLTVVQINQTFNIVMQNTVPVTKFQLTIVLAISPTTPLPLLSATGGRAADANMTITVNEFGGVNGFFVDTDDVRLHSKACITV